MRTIIAKIPHALLAHLKRGIGFVLILLSISAHAQQPQVYNQFFMNPYIYNPAYAGVEGHAAIFVMYRSQWTNVEGAPSISHASFHVPLDGGLALGGAAFNITQGLLNTSAAKATGAYLINIDRTHFVRFGLSLGAGINSVNISEFDSPGDQAFDNFLDQSTFFLGDFGVTYHFGHFNVGFALPNLFSYNPITQSEIGDVAFSPQDNILFKANYRGHINDDFAFEPHLLYRYSAVLPDQYEVTLIAHLYHVVWVGASYRQEKDLIFLAGAKVKEKIGVGFSYELGNAQIASELGPTLEISLGYHLGTKKEHAEHVSSFIKSHRLSAEERARKAEVERQKQLAELQKSRSTPSNEEDELSIAQSGSTTSGAISTPTGTGGAGAVGAAGGELANGTTNPDSYNDSVSSSDPAETSVENSQLDNNGDDFSAGSGSTSSNSGNPTGLNSGVTGGVAGASSGVLDPSGTTNTTGTPPSAGGSEGISGTSASNANTGVVDGSGATGNYTTNTGESSSGSNSASSSVANGSSSSSGGLPVAGAGAGAVAGTGLAAGAGANSSSVSGGATGANASVPFGTDPYAEADIPTKRSNGWSEPEGADKLTRVAADGTVETGTILQKPGGTTGDKNTVISWVPSSEAPNYEIAKKGHLERTLPDQTDEVGIKYKSTTDRGKSGDVIKWDPALTAATAAVIAKNPDIPSSQYEELSKGDPQLTNDFRSFEELASSDQPLVSRRGTHLLELPEGNYVIAGAFSDFQNAEDYSDDLFQLGYHDTLVGYNSGRGYYYVVVFQSPNLTQTRSKRDDFRRKPELSKAWVLQVTN